MANYLEMNREELTAEKAKLNEQYKKFLAMNLKLNMARGKPGPHQSAGGPPTASPAGEAAPPYTFCLHFYTKYATIS